MMQKRNARIMTKAVSLLLALWLCGQCAAAVLASPAQAEQDYTGNVLAAINTDYTPGKKTFSAHTLSGEAAAASDAQADEQVMTLAQYLQQQMQPMSAQEAAEADAMEGEVDAQGLFGGGYRLGQIKTIQGANLAGIPIDFSMSLEEISTLLMKAMLQRSRLKCVYIGKYCTVWNEVDGKWSQENCEKLGRFADETIPKILDLFGDRRIDTDGDGKFALFVYAFPEGSGAGGYFNQIDLIDKSGRIGKVRMQIAAAFGNLYGYSAGCDCMHISDAYDDFEDLQTVFAHEYQHYIHFSYCYAGKTNETVLSADDTYLDEAFSMASQHMVYLSPYYSELFMRSFRYARYDRHSLVQWNNVTTAYEDAAFSYGMSYLFGQYFRTRYAALTGDTATDNPGKGIYKRVLESRTLENQNNTLGIIADILYPAQQYPSLADTDARCRQLIEDFWLAVFCKEPQGEHGFNGETWANSFYTALQEGLPAEDTVCSAMGAFYTLNEGQTDTAVVDKAEEGLRFIALEGEERTLTLDYNDGSGKTETIRTLMQGCAVPAMRMFRAGYVFAGWATEPDAAEAQYGSREEVVLRDTDTLYAVWKRIAVAEPLVPIAVACPDGAEGECTVLERIQFTPAQDGVYFVQGDNCSPDDVSIESVDGKTVTYDSSSNACCLTGGVAYEMKIAVRFDASSDARLTIRQRDTYYTLHYCVQVDGKDYSWTGEYGDAYILDSCPDWKTGFLFAGWAQTPDASSPAYQAGDTLALQRETTLYPVWKPCPALTEKKKYKPAEEDYFVSITPKKTASYKIWAYGPKDEKKKKPFVSLDVCDAEGRFLFACKYANLTYTLEGGKTYYLYFWDEVAEIGYAFASSSLNHVLYLKAEFSGLDISLKGKTTYTIPANYYPEGMIRTFEYWYDELTGEQYLPGDTITINRDTVLQAKGTLNLSMDETEDLEGYIRGAVKELFGVYRRYFRCCIQRFWIILRNRLGLL